MKRLLALLILLPLLAAGCGDVPTAVPVGQSPAPTPESYPPPTVELGPTRTPRPTRTPQPTWTPTPEVTVLPVPVLQAQSVPPELSEGERIAFLRDGNLWLVRPDGAVIAQVTTSGNVTALYGWSHNCTQLLVGVGERPIPPETEFLGGRDLWVVQVDSTQAYPLIQGLEVVSAEWSPIRDQIAYGTRQADIHLLNSDGTGHRTLLDAHSGFLGSWSPDGSRIAFSHMPVPLDQWTINLAILDVATGSVSFPLPERTNRVDYRPYVWSGDGNRILFQSERKENWIWWEVDLERNDPHPIPGTETFVVVASGVSKSPVADQITLGYYALDTDVPSIWVMDFDGSNLRRLSEGTYPVWSADGQKIAYIGPEWGLWITNLDGSEAIRIAEEGQSRLLYEPYWCR